MPEIFRIGQIFNLNLLLSEAEAETHSQAKFKPWEKPRLLTLIYNLSNM